MAQLKIDVVVDDNGAAQKLAQIEQGLTKVDAAAGRARDSQGRFVKGVGDSTAAAAASIQGASAKSVSAFASMNNAAMGFFKTMGAFVGANVVQSVASTIANVVGNSVKMAGSLVDLSAKTGLTISTLQKLDFVGMQAGVSMEQFASAVFKVGNRIGKSNGSDGVAWAVKELGLNLLELKNMNPDKQIETLLSALSRVGDEQDRNALGVELFGKSFEGVAAAVTSGYDEMWKSARTSGDEQIKALDDAADAWDRFTQNAQANLVNLLGSMVQMIQGAQKVGFFRTIGLLATQGVGVTGVTLSAAAGAQTAADADAREMRFWEDAQAHPDQFARAGGLSPRSSGKPTKPARDAAAEKAKRDRAAWLKENEDITGMSAIKAADEWMIRLKEIGGITKLSDKAFKDLATTMQDALEAANRLGKHLTPQQLAAWAATQKAETMAPGMMGLSQATMDEEDRRQAMIRLGMSAGGPKTIPQEIIKAISAESMESARDKPGFLKSAFGGSKQFGGDMAGVLLSAITGGGNVGGAAGGFLGQGLGGMLGKTLSKNVGGMLGGVLGSVVPGLGTILGSLGGGLIGKVFGGLFGGGKEKKETNQTRDQFIQQFGGLDKLKQTFEDLGLSSDKFFNAKKVKDFNGEVDKLNAAMQKQKDLIDGIGMITEGVNARAANVSSQGDLNVVGAGALASFGMQVGTGTSAVEALANLTPAITAMRDAMAGGNFEMSTAGQKLLELGAIVEANRIPLQNLAADGQIVNGMMKGNIQDFDLFRNIAADIGLQLQGMIEKGVPTQQVLALAQPQLQSLWEAQQKWHVEVDATTQALIDQAVQQGMVGENMKSIQQQMLDATIGIRDALQAIGQHLGAIPAAAKAAGDAMSGMPAPATGGEESAEPGSYHTGGVIGWRRMHSGGLASDEIPIIGQKGEFVISRRGVAATGLDVLNRINAGQSVDGGVVFHPGSIVINGDVDSEDRAKRVVDDFAMAVRLNLGGSFQKANAALGNA